MFRVKTTEWVVQKLGVHSLSRCFEHSIEIYESAFALPFARDRVAFPALECRLGSPKGITSYRTHASITVRNSFSFRRPSPVSLVLPRRTKLQVIFTYIPSPSTFLAVLTGLSHVQPNEIPPPVSYRGSRALRLAGNSGISVAKRHAQACAQSRKPRTTTGFSSIHYQDRIKKDKN